VADLVGCHRTHASRRGSRRGTRKEGRGKLTERRSIAAVGSFLGTISEAVVPRRLGTSFRWLLGSTIVNNVGDGIALAAGPLLVASLTRDPFVVSLALLSQWLPVLLFGIGAGVAADRFDRRRMVVVVDLGRAFVLVGLVIAIVIGAAGVPLVLGVLFILGSAEAVADSASSTLLPSLVARDDLGVANARMQGAFLLTNQLLLPPIGAFLFSLWAALPFGATAAAAALGAVLITRIRGSLRSERTDVGSIWSDMRDGVRWLTNHAPMRTLALTILAFNVTYGAAWGVLVLYATERLKIGEVGFGLLTTATAVGGVIGVIAYGALERRFRLGDIMRVGLLIETGTHLVLALTTSAAVALVTLAVFGGHAFVWGTTSNVVRQRAVPNELLGRVGGLYRVALVGGLVVGAPLGGLLAAAFGITAPFWFGFAGSAVLVALLWKQFDHIAHDPSASAG
jgi:predicted MFS family arabinose efflux permease